MIMSSTSTKAVVLWISFALFLNLTRPTSLPVWGLIIPFILLYFALWYTMRAIIERVTTDKIRSGGLSSWMPRVVAVSLTVIIILQSIGQLTLRDVVALTLLAMLGVFYVRRTRLKQIN